MWPSIPLFLLTTCALITFGHAHGLSLLQNQFYAERDQSTASSINFSTARPPPALLASLNAQLPREVCSKLQHEVQKAVILHKWGLDNLKFQQRLKRHPKYIVTIQVIRVQHEPIVELKCSASSPPSSHSFLSPSTKDGPKLEFLFHETRFMADSVRLFDIHSIFPIHTGSMSVKMKLDPLVITLDPVSKAPDHRASALRGSGLEPDASASTAPGSTLNINNVYFAKHSLNGDGVAKEHREDLGGGDDLLDLEKEIESVFLNRIQPDVQNQLKEIIQNTVKSYLAKNYIRI